MGRRLLVALLAALALGGAAGCGGDDVDSVGERARTELERARRQGEDVRKRVVAIGERLRRRVREVLDDIRQAVPRASQPQPRTAGRTATATIDGYLTDVLGSIDRYWTRTLREAGLPEPRVRYLWVPPGRRAITGCRTVADENAAFYCTADDTIYLSQQLASELWRGISDTFPGERAGYGRAVGDFGLAYVVAHEYAHNIQNELGFYSLLAHPGGQAVRAAGGLHGGAVGELRAARGPDPARRRRGGGEHGDGGRRLRLHERAAPRHAAGAARRLAARLQERRPAPLRRPHPGLGGLAAGRRAARGQAE